MVSRPKKHTHCVRCGNELPFHRGTYCSEACRSKPKSTIQCIQCGNVASRRTSSTHCSDECKRKTNIERGKKRREQIRRTTRGRIDPIKVFKRDNWHCKMCGKLTPKELIGTFNNDSPTIDHIEPLSKGGLHVYRNLQLLCQYCNCSIKRNNDTKAIDARFCNHVQYEIKQNIIWW